MKSRQKQWGITSETRLQKIVTPILLVLSLLGTFSLTCLASYSDEVSWRGPHGKEHEVTSGQSPMKS